MDCKGKPEIVVIENTGNSSQNLTGWKVEDDGPTYTFNFPSGFSLEPGSSVELISGESGDDTDKAIYWNNRVVWNNDGDTASLFNSRGQLVSEKACP
jgi:competence protein ComEC